MFDEGAGNGSDFATILLTRVLLALAGYLTV